MKLCAKDGVSQSGFVTKLCVKDVCERWRVTMLCDRDGVRKSCVCRGAISATPAKQNEG